MSLPLVATRLSYVTVTNLINNYNSLIVNNEFDLTFRSLFILLVLSRKKCRKQMSLT